MQPALSATANQLNSLNIAEVSSSSTTTKTANKIQVIRRDGSVTCLDITKIRSVVEWACAGKEVNPITLEAGLTTRLRNGVTTREIQDNLIDCALGMCSPSETDWRYVAGRLHIWNLWKDTIVSRGYGYLKEKGVRGKEKGNNLTLNGQDFDRCLSNDKQDNLISSYPDVVRLQVENNLYDRAILKYSAEELAIAGDWINPEWDKDYDYAGAVLLTKRYLLPDELPQEAYLTCALLLASQEKPEQRLSVAKQFYEAIAQRKISLATPILANLRVPNGSLSSCFIIGMDDNFFCFLTTDLKSLSLAVVKPYTGINIFFTCTDH